MNKNKIKDTKKSPTTNVVYLKNVRNIKGKNVKKGVKKTKWSKSLSSKSLKCAAKFLLSLCDDKEGVSKGMFEFLLRSYFVREYLINRQFMAVLEYDEMAEVPDDLYSKYWDDAFHPGWIQSMIFENKKSSSTNKTNIYGLYINNDGTILSDETHPHYFKFWNRNSDKEIFLSDLEYSMLDIIYMCDHLFKEEDYDELDQKIAKFIKTL